ncbi:hypothetical protein CLAIMM_13456, partial [Cladophialophora immunda]
MKLSRVKEKPALPRLRNAYVPSALIGNMEGQAAWEEDEEDGEDRNVGGMVEGWKCTSPFSSCWLALFPHGSGIDSDFHLPNALSHSFDWLLSEQSSKLDTISVSSKSTEPPQPKSKTTWSSSSSFH